MNLPNHRLLTHGGSLLYFRPVGYPQGALVRDLSIIDFTQEFHWRGFDDGIQHMLVFPKPMPLQIGWRFVAYNIPDRLRLAFDPGGVLLDTGYIGARIGMPDEMEGDFQTERPVKSIRIVGEIMPGWTGTVFDVYLSFNPLL